jgi:thymidylate synthase
VSVNDPITIDDEIKKYADNNMITWIHDNFLSLKGVKNEDIAMVKECMILMVKYDQFENIAKKLLKNPESRSTAIFFMYLGHDGKHMPCIVALDFKIRNNKIN